jgi:acyl carrier protein
MNSSSQALVYALVASILQINETLKAEDPLDELGLDTLDLILLATKLEELDPGNGAFPLETLAHARTMGDLVELVDVWSQRDTSPGSIDGVPSQRSAG